MILILIIMVDHVLVFGQSPSTLLSVNVMVGKEQKIPAKTVCVRNKKNKKNWIAFICTNPDLWKTLADRGLFQDIQVLSSAGDRMPWSVV